MSYQSICKGLKKEAAFGVKLKDLVLNPKLGLMKMFYKNLLNKGILKVDEKAYRSLPKALLEGVRPIKGLSQVERNAFKEVLPQFQNYVKGNHAGFYVGDVFSEKLRKILGDEYLDRWLKVKLNFHPRNSRGFME